MKCNATWFDTTSLLLSLNWSVWGVYVFVIFVWDSTIPVGCVIADLGRASFHKS